MSNELGYRLSFNELIFLAAKTEATEIYGLKHSLKEMSPEEISKEWNVVRDSLMEKKYLTEEDGTYVISGTLFDIMRVISHPRLFYVCQSRDEFSGNSCNYYVQRDIAVKLEYEASYKDIYTLTPYRTDGELKDSVQNFFEISGRNFEKANQKIRMGLDEFTEFITSITDNDKEKQIEILSKKAVAEEYILDISKSLGEKNCLRTMLVISFNRSNLENGETQNSVVKEYMIYGGTKYLWQVELREKVATIESISLDTIMHKIEILSNVLYYL